MGDTYTQTIEFSVWKEHTCACCATVYRYLFKRKMSGEGKTPEAAAKNAQKAVERALENEVDLQPCPECGLYQPDMVAVQRATRHWWVFWAGIPVVALLLILALAHGLALSTVALLMGILALPFVIGHLAIDFLNPNGNLKANRKRARQLAKKGDIWVPEDEQPKELDDRSVGNGITGLHYVVYLMLGASVLAFLLPLGVQALTGMKRNAGWYPEVAGPGDSTVVYFKERISSIKGYWNGSANVVVTNAAELGGPVSVTAMTNTQTWGNTITVKSSEKNSSFAPWVRVQLPSNPQLAGKTVQMQITLNVVFPKVMGANQWQEQRQTVTQTVALVLSNPGAGGLFKFVFWMGFVGGSLLLLVGGVLTPILSNQFKKKAYKSRIFVPEGQLGDFDEEEEQEEEDDAYDDRPQRRGIRGRREVDYEEDEEKDRSRRGRRREEEYEDDYEDDRPRGRRREEEYEDDYEDDRPRRRRREVEDDDYDDRPRKRRRDDDY